MQYNRIKLDCQPISVQVRLNDIVDVLTEKLKAADFEFSLWLKLAAKLSGNEDLIDNPALVKQIVEQKKKRNDVRS